MLERIVAAWCVMVLAVMLSCFIIIFFAGVALMLPVTLSFKFITGKTSVRVSGVTISL